MSLAGKRVLVVEDEMLVAMNLENMLIDMDAMMVCRGMRLDTALELARSESVDLAVLDINLHGGRSYPVAEVLRPRHTFRVRHGLRPCGSVDAFVDVPTLLKPYRNSELEAALTSVLSTR